MAKRAGKATARRAEAAESAKSNGRARSERIAKARADLIISKTRTKAAATMNVAGDFYSALDKSVRSMIREAEARAANNGRRTLRPHDL